MSNNQQDTDFDTLSRMAVRDWKNGSLSFDEARRRIQALIQEAQKSGDKINQAHAHLTMSYLFSMRGRHEHALGWAKNAERLYKQVNDLSLLSGVYITQGEIHRSLGDYAQASKLFKEAYQAALEVDDKANQLFARGNEGHVALAQNHPDKARDLLQESLAMLAPYLEKDSWLASPKAVYCEYQAALAEAYFRLKNYEKAWENAAQAYQFAQELSEQGIEFGKVNETIGALISGAEIPASYARFGTDFRPYFEAAVASYKAVGFDLDHAQACVLYGDCLAAHGDKAAAKSQFQSAISLYSSLGMYPQARQATQKINHLNSD